LEATSQAIRRTFQAAQDRLDAEQARIIAEWPTMPRTARLSRLRELQATVDELMAAADQLALRWAQRGLPEAYTLGATTAATAAAGTSPVFTQVAVDALNLVVQDTFEDLLSATTHVRSTAKDQIRYLAKDRIADRLIRGTTPAQAAKELAQDLASKGITAVTYKDGSTRTLADYTDMLIRTRTAEVHQIGGFDQADAFGIKYMEIFDGASCGWTSHQDPNPANGKIVTVEEARAYPLSHPRCRRSSSPRPDITTKAQAKKAQPSTTAAQRADQSSAEKRHAATVERRRLARNGIISDRGSKAQSPAAIKHAKKMAAKAAPKTYTPGKWTPDPALDTKFGVDLLGNPATGTAIKKYSNGNRSVEIEVDLTEEQTARVLQGFDQALETLPDDLVGAAIGMSVQDSPHFTPQPKGVVMAFVYPSPELPLAIYVNPRLARGELSQSQADIDFYSYIHEMGHIVDRLRSDTRNPVTLLTNTQDELFWLITKDANTAYGQSSVAEGYAEAYAKWQLDKTDPLGQVYHEFYGWKP
jgi:hypothetical protein